MSDEADRAEEAIEVALEAAIAAARGVKPQPGRICRECGEDLPAHRQPYGTCYTCQVRLESRMRRGLVGA
jgi:hypothetical protein